MIDRDVRREFGDLADASFSRLNNDADLLESMAASYYRTYGTVTEGKRIMRLSDDYRKLAAKLDRLCNDYGIR